MCIRDRDKDGNEINNKIGVNIDDTTIEVLDDIKDFRVVFDVEALDDGQLRGDESVELLLERDNFVAGDEADLGRGDLDCDPVDSKDPFEFEVTATAACEKEDSLTGAKFTFLVEGAVNPGRRKSKRESLRGTYDYVINKGGGLAVDESYWDSKHWFEDKDGEMIEENKIEVDIKNKTIEVKDSDIKDFRVVFDVEALDDGQLRGDCLLYTSPSPRDRQKSRMPSSA